MMKKIILLLCLLLLVPGITSAASFNKVAEMPDEQSRNFLISLAGTPVWLDKNSSYGNKNEFHYMQNIEHALIGNVDVDHGIIEIILDNGNKFTWQPKKQIDAEQRTGKILGKVAKSPAVITAKYIQWLFYFKNPYEVFPNWSNKAWDAIRKQEVYPGMTETMCLLSWGEPDDKNRSIGVWGTHEQWVYGTDFNDRSYLYLENGVLTSIQD